MKKRIALFALLVLFGGLLLDRIALYLWQVQILGLYQDLSAALEQHRVVPQPGHTGFVAFGSETFLVMPRDPRWPVRYLTLRTDRALLRVTSVTVDGVGNLHLRFFPPALAWTTRLFPRNRYTHHGDPTAEDPRYHYQFKLDLTVAGPGKEAVTLQRGEYHFAPPLTGSALRPRWFY